MNKFSVLPLVLGLLLSATSTFAQEVGQPIQGQTNTAMVTATSTSYFSTVQTQGADPLAGDPSGSGSTNSAAGAEGTDTSSFAQLSKGALIAIIVVVCCVVIFGSR